MFNSEQLKSIVRQTILVLGGYLVGRGWVHADTVTALATNEAVIGLIIAIGGSVWALVAKTGKNLQVAAATVNPQAIIVTDAETAAATPAQGNIIARDEVKVVAK